MTERRDFVKGLGAALGLGRARFRRVDPADAANPFCSSATLGSVVRNAPRAFRVPMSFSWAGGGGPTDPVAVDLPDPLGFERNGVVLAWAAGTYSDDGGG